MHRLVADDQADQVGGIGQLRAARPVHRQVEARIEQEAFQKHRGDLALQGVRSGLVFVQDQPRLGLQMRVFLGPAECLVDLLGQAQRRKDRAIAARMHRLHETDIGQHRLLMRRLRIRHHRGRADGILHRVQKRQPGKDANGQLALLGAQGGPALHVIRQRHLFRQPEIHRQPVPDLQILLVLQAVPVDRAQRGLHHMILHPKNLSFMSKYPTGVRGCKTPGVATLLTRCRTRSPELRSPPARSGAGGCNRSS